MDGLGDACQNDVDAILYFFDESAENKTIKGLGSKWFAEYRIKKVRRMLKLAVSLIENEKKLLS